MQTFTFTIAGRGEGQPVYLCPREPASTRITAVDQSADGIVLDELASFRSRQALIDFLKEPIFVVDEPLHRFLHQCLRVAALPHRDV